MELTEERRALREAVRDLLAKHQASTAAPADPESPTRYDEALWSRLCGEIGVAGLAVPERFGGSGASVVETHLVLDELGQVLAASPMLGSAVLGGQALLLTADEEACRRLLPGLADGSRLTALVWAGPAGTWDRTDVAVSAGPDGRLTGAAHYVLDGDLADTLLVLAREPAGVGLYEVDGTAVEARRAAVTTMDATRRLATIDLRAAPAHRLGAQGSGFPVARLLDIACTALSAEQVGAAARALALTVGYTRTRVQFGQPIGAFQALQHRLADLRVQVDSARSASYAAATAVAAGAPDAPTLAAVAKVYCSETLQAVAAEMIQMHGALGIAWEHDAHRYFKRAHGSAQLFGPPHRHVARIATALIDGAPLSPIPRTGPPSPGR